MRYGKEEKRRHKRHVVNGIQGNVLYPSDLNIINISIDGAAIETTKRLELNREYSFKIKHKDAFIDLKGRVVWSMLSQSESKDSGELIPVYKAGIRFTNIFNERANLLINFIEENRIKTYERRFVGIRVKIATPRNITIDFPCRYDIKKMSLSGMLVETESPLEINAHYDMEILLSENVLNVEGRVASCIEIISGDISKYDVGIEFMKISDENRSLLKSYLDTLGET